MAYSDNNGVYGLLTNLCSKTASQYHAHSRISQKILYTKMRSHAYEIILKKSTKEYPTKKLNPMIGLLSQLFIYQQNTRNISEYKRVAELSKVIQELKSTNFGDCEDDVYNALRFLISLSDSIQEDQSTVMYHKPFSFGLLDEMLPKPCRQPFSLTQPYAYYPPHVFQLPFSLEYQGPNLDSQKSQNCTEYTVESFDSGSLLLDSTHRSHKKKDSDLKTFLSPMSLASMTSTHMSPYSENNIFNLPRLRTPRDLTIPSSEHADVKVSLASNSTKDGLKEMFRAQVNDDSLDVWELASQIDKHIPDSIWDIVSKLPPITERQLIASSKREIGLWHQTYCGMMSDLDIITEKQFIRHIMYLIIGIETSSFPFSEESNCFYMKRNLVLEGISKEHIKRYVADLILVGTYYRRLYKFAFNQTLRDHFHSNGLVYEAAREVIRRYLLEFRLIATQIYEDCQKSGSEDMNCMPTLLQISYHIEPLKYEIETIVSIYKLIDSDPKSTLPHGAELMSYLFNEISLVTHKKTARTMFDSLFAICKVYFKFIEKFIFEGELDDRHSEFFIRKDSQYVNCQSKRYWDKGFHITQSVAVPEFLRPLAKFILLCGKSLRLLKLCNPNDPLILLISSDHPAVRACASFEELERQQQMLDVYRTRCLFVSGDPVTFEQIMLKRDAERKAFTEMASLKQAETMEKIVAERKRLAQLIVAEKQHSLRVLEAAMAEAKAAKRKAQRPGKVLSELAADKAAEEVDSKLRDDERDKIMEYYSKLNMEVEKSKMHTEWKIKRLQLDQSRMQLLSTEERNLKREKLELEHQKNEDIMAMSIQSLDPKPEDEIESKFDDNNVEDKMSISTNSVTMLEIDESPQPTEFAQNKMKSQTSSDVFNAICNVAKSFFGVAKGNDNKYDDNTKELDSQGNVVAEINSNSAKKHQYDEQQLAENNLQYIKSRQEALLNKQKVMAHEFGQTDNENNQLNDPPLINVITVDEENNIQDDSRAFLEAKRNKLKVLGTEFGMKTNEKVVYSGPRTDAQREALINKQKVLGVEYNLPAEVFQKREPANVAQEEAQRNRTKVLTSDQEANKPISPKREATKRSGLTLNLKPYTDSLKVQNVSTPNLGSITPGDLFPRLDLETPTTADIPPEGPMTCDVFTPQSDGRDLETTGMKCKVDKDFITSEGFNFPVLDDESVGPENTSDGQTDEFVDTSPTKSGTDIELESIKNKYSFFNILDGSYDLEDFDPFGVKELAKYSKDPFSCKMDLEMKISSYTHPALIMEEVKKKPYSDIFLRRSDAKHNDASNIACDNIATLTACLQRSVMLPLTYQLEVVNNSILTYFLVNLDIYEHLRSLKDYFFLMDGEFSRSICHNLFSKLSKTLNPQELLNFATLHNILDKALGSSISHIHKFSENVSFTITESPLSFQHSSPDVLQCLSLTYAVSWPLNVILSQEALLRYAKVFQFLVKMRRISWVLGEDFENLKLAVKLSREHSRRLLRSPHYISIQIYRHIMASMVRALDSYIVATCILSSWTEFENDLKKARTLDDLYECHVVYIKKVLFRCLLNNRSTPVMKLLNDMFTVILKFSRVLKAGEWQENNSNAHFTHSSFVQLEELFHLFEKIAKYLHKVVTKLMECGYQRHLVELLIMTNLNEYYNSDRPNNTTVQSA